MFVPATAGKLSVHKEVMGGTKDDGSGSVDKAKEKDATNEEKTSKGLFGLLGLRRSRSSKNINSAPLSVASKEKATPKQASSKDSSNDVRVEKAKQAENVEKSMTTVGVAAAASAAVTVSSNTNTNQQQEINPEERTNDEIGPSTTQEKLTNDDSDVGKAVGEAVKDATEVEYAQIQRKAKPEEVVEDVFLKMPESEDALSHNARGDETEVPHVGDESSEHVPSNDQPGPETVRSQFEEQEFSPFADTEFEVDEAMNNIKPTDDSLAFGEATSTADAAFEDAFGDSFAASTPLQVNGFSKEPFQSFNETVDVVLDGDESVFDPNSPISPADFKAIPNDAGVTGLQSQPNLSTSDISISSHVDSLDDDGPSSSPDSLPDKLPKLVDPPSFEKHAITEDVQANSFDVENVISNAGENVAANIDHVSIDAGAVVTDPTHTGNESFSIASHDGSGRRVDESPDTTFQNSASHHEMTDTRVRTQDPDKFCDIGYSEGDLHDSASVSTVAAVSSTLDVEIVSSPGEIQSPPIEDQRTNHQEIVERLEIKTNVSEDPAISHDNDDTSQAHTDKEIFSDIAPDQNSNVSVYDMAKDNVHLYGNVSYNNGRDPASNIVPVSDKTVASTLQFPPPNNTHDIESNSEIPPIYEEPPKDDDPIHDVSSSSSNNHPRLPHNYLFSVQALYKYRSTDDDELSFNKGDIIYIIVHPDPEEQDEGWQMGVRQIDWEENGENASMGVFPENFTKEIEL